MVGWLRCPSLKKIQDKKALCEELVWTHKCTLSAVCRVLGLSKSTVHGWLNKPHSTGSAGAPTLLSSAQAADLRTTIEDSARQHNPMVAADIVEEVCAKTCWFLDSNSMVFCIHTQAHKIMKVDNPLADTPSLSWAYRWAKQSGFAHRFARPMEWERTHECTHEKLSLWFNRMATEIGPET